MNLYFLRHGETALNAQHIIQGGGIDSELNDVGRKQAQQFFDAYKFISFKALYCSELKRTYQSLEPFLALGYPVYKKAGFNELRWGDLEGKKHEGDVSKQLLDLVEEWDSGNLALTAPNGESPLQVWERVNSVLQDIFQVHSSGNLLICTHGRTLRITLSMLLGYGADKMQHFPHHNFCLNLLVRTPEGTYYAEKLNDISHLS